VEYEVKRMVPFFASCVKPPHNGGVCLILTSGTLPTDVIAGSAFLSASPGSWSELSLPSNITSVPVTAVEG
jgi:hypothetical protein